MRAIKSNQIALRNCSGMAKLLSIRAQLFTTAAFVQNWPMYAPSLLKDCTSLLMIAVLIGPRNGSSPVSTPSRSTSNNPGNPTTFFLSGVTSGLWLLMALTPILSISPCLACRLPLPPAFVEELGKGLLCSLSSRNHKTFSGMSLCGKVLGTYLINTARAIHMANCREPGSLLT